MKIVADENVAYRIIKSLRLRGYEIISISEDKPSIPDNNVLHFANEQNAILLTEDSDFGELVFNKKLLHSGILYLRLAGLTVEEKLNKVMLILETKSEVLKNNFCVLDKKGFRIKKEPLIDPEF